MTIPGGTCSWTRRGKLVSLTNQREHRMVTARRAKVERVAAWALTREVCADFGFTGEGACATRPLTVTIIRLGPRALDDDNLRAACKSIRDGISDALSETGSLRSGDDADPRVRWSYRQERQPTYSVRVEIEATAG